MLWLYVVHAGEQNRRGSAMIVTVRCCNGRLMAAQVLNVVGSQVMLSSRMTADDDAWVTWWVDLDDGYPIFESVLPVAEDRRRIRKLTAVDIAPIAVAPRDKQAVDAANKVLAQSTQVAS